MQRLVGSLVANTPEHLLQEIMFVDDQNPANTSYADVLEALHPKVKVHRNAERQGLTKANKWAVLGGPPWVPSPQACRDYFRIAVFSPPSQQRWRPLGEAQ